MVLPILVPCVHGRNFAAGARKRHALVHILSAEIPHVCYLQLKKRILVNLACNVRKVISKLLQIDLVATRVNHAVVLVERLRELLIDFGLCSLARFHIGVSSRIKLKLDVFHK